MSVVWLLLSLLTAVQTVTARGRDLLQSELEDWESPEDYRSINIHGAGSCGVPAIRPDVNDVRVVGGVEAIHHSWPWMVSLQADGRHFCGGTLINNQWVVTAAHCHPGFKTVYVNESIAVVGLHSLSNPDEYTVRVPLSEVIINHKFDRPGRQLTSDIMLLKLEHPVDFNDAVSPVCMPPLFQLLPSGKRCYTSGWGTLSTGGESPDKLQQVMLPLIENEVCNQPGWHNYTLDDSMVCAGYEQGELGNCHGDSGGPLVCLEDGHWLLYGVVSWGSVRGCAVTNGPTVYARASAYIKWIRETISEHSK